MVTTIRTNSDNRDFSKLVNFLDADLKIRDGEDHSFYAQFNKTDALKYVVIAYENETPLGCGSIKEYDLDTMEIKRMFTVPNGRGKGIAQKF
ncbi:MAG: GNAT family N-acetyltransferase [Melioribacteraceae bacterium]|nr:GNAT family N-acetyltransferase [Melioribacteraceae bacterium]